MVTFKMYYRDNYQVSVLLLTTVRKYLFLLGLITFASVGSIANAQDYGTYRTQGKLTSIKLTSMQLANVMLFLHL